MTSVVAGGAQALYGNPGAGVKMIVVSSGQLAGTTSKPVRQQSHF